MENSRQAPTNISLSIELKGSFLGQARRSTLSCCLSTTISASSAARDRKRSAIIPKNNLLHPDIKQQHRPILCQPATGSDLRQGQVISGIHGFSVSLSSGLSVKQRNENSGVLVRPMTIAPAFLRLRTTGASEGAIMFICAGTPLGLGLPS
jgi:hypothetical protein